MRFSLGIFHSVAAATVAESARDMELLLAL